MEDTNFSVMDDQDALKIALVFFVERFLMGRDTRGRVDPFVMQLVNDLEAFNRYCWGTVSWELTYKYLSNALTGRAKKFKEQHKKNNKHKCERYNLEGIPIAFQVYANLIYDFIMSVTHF